jgi:SAM-dependent methyltransferase
MKPRDREDKRYAQCFENPVDKPEQILLQYLNRFPKGTVLDVGCGSGVHASLIKHEGFNVIGVDFSIVAINQARKRGVESLVVDVDDGLPFQDSTFEYVWATDVLEHVFDPVGLITEFTRVLNPHGRLLITVPNDFNLANRFDVFLTGRSPQSRVYRERGQYKHHTLFSLELLRYMLVDRGGLRLDLIYGLSRGGNLILRHERIACWLSETFVVGCSKPSVLPHD